METLPVEGEESLEDSSTESPPEEIEPVEETEEFVSSSSPANNEEFETRVTKLMEMMEGDSKVRDRILAEIYVNIASAEQGIRGVFEMVQTQGVGGFMRGAFKRG